jgi:hypothetical protein
MDSKIREVMQESSQWIISLSTVCWRDLWRFDNVRITREIHYRQGNIRNEEIHNCYLHPLLLGTLNEKKG